MAAGSPPGPKGSWRQARLPTVGGSTSFSEGVPVVPYLHLGVLESTRNVLAWERDAGGGGTSSNGVRDGQPPGAGLRAVPVALPHAHQYTQNRRRRQLARGRPPYFTCRCKGTARPEAPEKRTACELHSQAHPRTHPSLQLSLGPSVPGDPGPRRPVRGSRRAGASGMGFSRRQAEVGLGTGKGAPAHLPPSPYIASFMPPSGVPAIRSSA